MESLTVDSLTVMGLLLAVLALFIPIMFDLSKNLLEKAAQNPDCEEKQKIVKFCQCSGFYLHFFAMFIIFGLLKLAFKGHHEVWINLLYVVAIIVYVFLEDFAQHKVALLILVSMFVLIPMSVWTFMELNCTQGMTEHSMRFSFIATIIYLFVWFFLPACFHPLTNLFMLIEKKKSPRIESLNSKMPIVMVLLVLALISIVVVDLKGAALQVVINGLIAGGMYGLIALGFTVIYRTVKFFHFAHGVVYAAGAYLAYTLVISSGLNPILSFFVASSLAGVAGVGIDRLVYYPLRRQKAANLVFLLASFGVFIFLQNLIQLIYGAQILTLRTGPVKEGYHFLGAVITDIQILILVVSMLLFISLWLFIQKTKLGKAMRAVADDPVGASVVGIYPEKIILVSFAIGSALAGAAGILISLETNIEPTMGMNAVLKGIIASIIGGIGSIPGAMFGGLFLGLAENLGIWKIQAGWKDCIAFVILIVFLLFRPRGIVGVKTKKEWL
jgi:branched-chain amino acid transport system permease protein